jgi:hypothetical protein
MFRVDLPGLLQGPNREIGEFQFLKRLSHGEMSGHIPRIAQQNMLAVLEHLEPVASQLRFAEAQLLIEIGEERQLLAALVVVILVFGGLTQHLAIDGIARVKHAAVQKQRQSVIEVALGQHLVGAFVLPSGSAALFGSQERQCNRGFLSHARRNPAENRPSQPNTPDGTSKRNASEL